MGIEKKQENKVNEPEVKYGRNLRMYSSFEEQENAGLNEMAALTPLQRMQRLRQLINMAYGMHGFDPENIAAKHSIIFSR